MAQSLRLKTGRRGLVIVAHPDDETIWCGGLFLRFPQVKWTILVLARASDADRAPKFRRVAAFYKAQGLMKDLDDEGRLDQAQATRAIKQIITKLNLPACDYLFSHGVNGEYGHYAHKATHEAVAELLQQKKLSAQEVYWFNYKKAGAHVLAPKADSTDLLKLSTKDYEAKRGVMSQLYGFDPRGIDANYCTRVEAYKKLKT